jgi:hypothetical protein
MEQLDLGAGVFAVDHDELAKGLKIDKNAAISIGILIRNVIYNIKEKELNPLQNLRTYKNIMPMAPITVFFQPGCFGEDNIPTIHVNVKYKAIFRNTSV